MNNIRKAAQAALEVLDESIPTGTITLEKFYTAKNTLRVALAEPEQEPVHECADNDSPWLICKSCAADGKCKKTEQEPVAWQYRDTDQVVTALPGYWPASEDWRPLYTAPPQQRQPIDGARAALIELEAECESLRADAARWRYINAKSVWRRHMPDDECAIPYALLAVRLPYTADLSCKATRENAIDAALKGSK